MRLFFAVELPPDVQAELGRLRPKDDDRDYRWANVAQLHVTLAFLGQQPAEQLPVLEAVGAQAATASQRGVLKLGQPGSFGSKRAPRVLWVALDGEIHKLEALQKRLDGGLRNAGFTLEDRPFRPHVTLARRRESARSGAPPDWPPAVRGRTEFELRHLTLFESRLSPRGPTYIPVFQFPLT
jgi:RNA 2',3'-cyclic 3'-phosphodiesterase